MIFLKNLFKASYKTISIQELEQKLKKGNLSLIDVRTKTEFSDRHIKGAKNVPLSTVASIQESKDKELYIICQSGVRSAQASRKLSKMGYQVTNVRGGMSAWTGHTVGGIK